MLNAPFLLPYFMLLRSCTWFCVRFAQFAE